MDPRDAPLVDPDDYVGGGGPEAVPSAGVQGAQSPLEVWGHGRPHIAANGVSCPHPLEKWMKN